MKTNWQLKTPLDAIVFDCDGTLSRIEGIDELADYNNVGPEVRGITDAAMTDGKLTLAIYEKRLNLVRPSKEQLDKLSKQYIQHITPDTQKTIQHLQEAGKAIYIVSAGLSPPVQALGHFLGVDSDNIFAVDIKLNHTTGEYEDFDRNSSLTFSHGKVEVLTKLREKHARIALVGDGMNDYLAAHKADCFIGFGGHFYREKIAQKSPFYIKTCSLLPMLALCLTPEEINTGSRELQQARLSAEQCIQAHDLLINGQ